MAIPDVQYVPKHGIVAMVLWTYLSKRGVFIILLFQLGLVEFRVSSVKWVKSVLGLGLGSVIGLTEDFPT